MIDEMDRHARILQQLQWPYMFRTPSAIVAAVLAGLVIVSAQPAPRQVALIIAGGTVITMDGDRRVLSPGSVVIDGTDIVAVDRPEIIHERFHPRETIEAAGNVIMPGLINTHTHAPMVMYRGLADDLALMEWLQKYIFPAEAKTVNPEFVRAGTRLAALEMIQSGTTTYADMYYFEEEIAKETKAAGLRAVLGETIIQFPSPDAKTAADGLARAEAFIREWRRDALITPAVAPHAMYTLDGPTLIACRDLSKSYNVPTLIHLAETQAELHTALERYRSSPVAYLDGLGFLGPGVLAAHGVWVTEPEIAVLKSRGVSVSHNPESNMKLASGIAPVPEYVKAGVTVGLGTDGAASNNDLDMFEAMRIASFLHKLHTGDPRVMDAQTVVEMATIGGARALGLDKQIGSIEVGKRADVIVVSMSSARQTPMYDPISHLVYTTRGDDVQTTIVNGKVLMRGRKVLTLDEASILKEARSLSEQVRLAVK
jgi:5-methylthioadenosine/S-adenosylhomocysteine deaminase